MKKLRWKTDQYKRLPYSIVENASTRRGQIEKKGRQAPLLPREVAKGRSSAVCGSDSIWQLRPSTRHPSPVSEISKPVTDLRAWQMTHLPYVVIISRAGGFLLESFFTFDSRQALIINKGVKDAARKLVNEFYVRPFAEMNMVGNIEIKLWTAPMQKSGVTASDATGIERGGYAGCNANIAMGLDY
ncbi:hypothetical protein HNY73_022942 [Argiope bruennichi]|uniref:Uncharacterized protein n=1 Tax=Argiope bruennichi TaxID=94029 RepID=A0A8T0E4Y3_ARGBR|nr:hypothetical protein HNY73_022942 [Argiope bruennichi]